MNTGTTWKQSCSTLWQFELARWSFRWQRFWDRIHSPRQVSTTLLAIGFVSLYVLAGFTVLSKRDVVDPQRLQLWLSGGMVLYGIYHAIKYVWSNHTRDEIAAATTTPAMLLWIGGGPLPRQMVVLHEVARVLPATMVKSMLLCVVLWRDVPNPIALWVGVMLALLTLECLRRIISHVVDACGGRERNVLRIFSVLVTLAISGQIVLSTIHETPKGSDPAEYMAVGIGEVAMFTASDAMQWFAFPLQPAAHLAVSEPLWLTTFIIPATWSIVHCLLQLLLSFMVIAALAYVLTQLDQWALDRRHEDEVRRLVDLQSGRVHPAKRPLTNQEHQQSSLPTAFSLTFVASILNGPIGALMSRQWHCIRRYRINVLISFAIPLGVSLSPLLTNTAGLADNQIKQWIFVVGGIALSSLLLAPPALQIDFRRDLKRMSLLRSFPVSASKMCVGMLMVPVAITVLFQWWTLAAAAWIACPNLWQLAWLAIAFPALALLTFAIENALFLTFPHQIHAQGIEMVIRAKVTFLWKGLVLALCPLVLFFWTMLCHSVLPESIAFLVAFAGSLIGCWIVSIGAFAILVFCWHRFDV